MSDRKPNKPARVSLLEERVERREGASEEENPYWAEAEAQPHPDPSLGCIRRGHCCRSSPGWFAPGEVEAAAAAKGLEAGEFVRRYIIIDSIELDGERVEVFAPLKIGRDGTPLATPGTRVDSLYRMFRSPCVFFDGDGCGIYEARPLECREYVCTKAPEDNPSHQAIARMWTGNQ